MFTTEGKPRVNIERTKRNLSKAVLLCILIILFVPSLLLSKPNVVAFNPQLTVSGTSLVDGNGNVVYLRGTEVDARTLYGTRLGYWFNQTDVEIIASYGGNILELHSNEFSVMMPQKDIVNATWFEQKMDKWINWTTQAGLYVIINLEDFEWRTWGDPQVPDWAMQVGNYTQPWGARAYNQFDVDFWDTSKPLQNATRNAFLDLFRFMAKRYASNPYVMYGIINEPFAHNPLANGTNSAHLSATYADFIGQVVDAIHSFAPNALVFVDKPYTWFHVSPDQYVPVQRKGIVWEDHLYVNNLYTNLAQWESKLNDFAHTYLDNFSKPFYLGEYGFINATTGVMEDDFPDWQDTLVGMVRYLNQTQVCGRSWHQYPALENRNFFTAAESSFILSTVLSARTPTIPSDINEDGQVDMRDLAYVAKHFGATPGKPTWDPKADINGNGRIDIIDLAIVAKHFGWHNP